MSLWGATVITNLASTVPFFGQAIVEWLWGGFSVDNPTLQKFFSLHYLLPFLILGLVGLHLIFLHGSGSNNPLGIEFKRIDAIPFTPYFMIKDFYSVLGLFAVFAYLVCFNPDVLGHSDNYIPANPTVTPTHIVPEWYFLPFYAILRSIPDKLLGVIALLGSILVLYTLPTIHKTEIKSGLFKPVYQIGFFLFVANSVILSYIGGMPIETPYLEIGRAASIFYFGYFALIALSGMLIKMKSILHKQKWSSIQGKKGGVHTFNCPL
jgi:ubiquinol-cytochrome c reductase cytochrome b subunit